MISFCCLRPPPHHLCCRELIYNRVPVAGTAGLRALAKFPRHFQQQEPKSCFCFTFSIFDSGGASEPASLWLSKRSKMSKKLWREGLLLKGNFTKTALRIWNYCKKTIFLDLNGKKWVYQSSWSTWSCTPDSGHHQALQTPDHSSHERFSRTGLKMQNKVPRESGFRIM